MNDLTPEQIRNRYISESDELGLDAGMVDLCASTIEKLAEKSPTQMYHLLACISSVFALRGIYNVMEHIQEAMRIVHPGLWDRAVRTVQEHKSKDGSERGEEDITEGA